MDKNECRESLLSLLKEFHNYCLENKLRYSVWFGTAIGLIRHGGFVPWDDDIDVVMPREDYDYFIKNYTNSSKYTLFHDGRKDYKVPYAKFADATTTSISTISLDNTGVFLDIFPFDLLDQNSGLLKKMRHIKMPMRNRNMKKCGNYTPTIYKTGTKFVRLRNIKNYFNYQMIPIRRLLSFYTFRKHLLDKLAKKAKGNAYFYLDYSLNKNIFYDNLFFDDLMLRQFENVDCYISSKYDEYLRMIYGNYMEIPSVENRVNHSYYSFYKK